MRGFLALRLGVDVTEGMKVSIKKLEFLGYPLVKTARSYDH